MAPAVGPWHQLAVAGALTETQAESHELNLSWLVQLRWWAVLAQSLLIFGVHYWGGTKLPLAPLLGILGLELVSNVLTATWLRRSRDVTERALAGFVALDLVLFTALLYFSGGPFNPFSFLYLIHLTLATLFLNSRWTWTLVALALVCSASLFLDHVPLPMDHSGHTGHMGHAANDAMDSHLWGMWVAMGTAASAIVFFMHRIRASVATRDAEIGRIRERHRRGEQLASLATLSAGAAHELSTPLSTIAVIAKELDRDMSQLADADPQLIQELRVIREQVDRCREILTQMSLDAGQPAGESETTVPVTDLLTGTIERLREPERVTLSYSRQAEDIVLAVPRRAVARAVRGLIKNALDASEDGSVDVRIEAKGDFLQVEVVDQGVGMDELTRRRAVEPFFTTKAPGEGMGLGLFLTRAVVENLGGSLELTSEPDHGTTATVLLPLQPRTTP